MVLCQHRSWMGFWEGTKPGAAGLRLRFGAKQAMINHRDCFGWGIAFTLD